MSVLDKLNNSRLPVVVAPMFFASNPVMAIECCKAGLVGSFPAHFPRTLEQLEEWVAKMAAHYAENPDTPYAINLVVHSSRDRYEDELAIALKYKAPILITSKGAPLDVCPKVHDYGGLVFHDVANKRHAEKAAAAGVDFIIAVSGGAGGHTGTLNPFALMNEVRQVTDKPIILGGSISTGRDVLAAQVMGASFAYMGTRFLATNEAAIDDTYKQRIIDSNATDILMTAALDGAPANWIKSSLEDMGINIVDVINTPHGQLYSNERLKGRYNTIASAGHGVGSIGAVLSVAALVDQLEAEFQTAKEAFALQKV